MQNKIDSWPETKKQIKAKWSKFSDSEIDGFKDNLDKVTAGVQKTYGIGKEQAEKEFSEFKKTIDSSMQH